MKFNGIYASMTIAVLCASCGRGGAGIANDGLVTIDVAANYPEKEIHLQAVADVEYIPLAISDEVLLSPSDRLFYLSDRFIMVQARRTGEIIIFDRAGEIVSHFNRQGRGPGEYSAVRDIVFDEAAEEFFVADRTLPNIEVYSLSGGHKRTLTLPEGWQVRVYNLDIDMPERYSTMNLKMEPGEEGRFNVRPFTDSRLGGNGFTLADISCDTVYSYTRQRALTPSFVRTPSVHASEPRVVWGMELATEGFVVFNLLTLDFELAWTGTYPPSRQLMYTYATNRIVEPSFIDDCNPSSSWSNSESDADLPPNTVVGMLKPLKLKETLDGGKLSGKLAEIAATIKEDDNPVVMIVKFK